MLLYHVGRVKHGSCEHELPMQTGRLWFHICHWHRRIGIVDGHNAALRPDQLHTGVPMPHVIEYGDVINVLETGCTHLLRHRLLMVDHMIRTQVGHPLARFIA